MYDIEKLNNKKVAELREIAEKLSIQKVDKLKKQELVYKILDEQALNPSKAENNSKTPKPRVDKEEKKEVLNEANKIYDVNNIFPSIYLVTELSINKI